MEKKTLIFLIFLASLSFFSCDTYLDRELSTDLTYEQVTKNYSYSRSRVAGIYSRLRDGFQCIDGAMMASASDEAEHTLESSAVQQFNFGSWNAYSNPDDVWGYYYKGIRDANLFLKNCDNIDLDIYKYDPDQQDVYRSRLSEINRWKYEVRFLRAFFYFELVKRYGGVPIILEAQESWEGDYSDMRRNTLSQCINFIVNECDSAASILPATYSSEDLGRATKIAALALKSRMLLYAASDLFNTSSWSEGYNNPELISLNNGDRKRQWKNAADAAKETIDLAESNGYSLSSNYASLFGPNTHINNEVIFCKRNGASNSFEKTNFPIGYDLGNSGTTPSQNLVDSYEMSNGKMIQELGSGYNPNDPYENRDPRLKMTIITNMSRFKDRNVEIWQGGKDGPPIVNSTKTGYYLKKYVNEDLNLLTGQTSVHTWIIFRLAEFYLNYAEALNEYKPGDPDIVKYLNKVRSRVQMPPLSENLNQTQMREKIRNERRVEFAFEDHRLWDLRRWMQAETFLSFPLRGMKITKNGNGLFNYEVIIVEPRLFQPKMYFYPLPQNELQVGKGLIQNPLW